MVRREILHIILTARQESFVSLDWFPDMTPRRRVACDGEIAMSLIPNLSTGIQINVF